MTAFSDDDPYRRGTATLVDSWAAYARGTPVATMLQTFGVVCAVFPHEPEHIVYNNALLARDLPAGARGRLAGDSVHVRGG